MEAVSDLSSLRVDSAIICSPEGSGALEGVIFKPKGKSVFSFRGSSSTESDKIRPDTAAQFPASAVRFFFFTASVDRANFSLRNQTERTCQTALFIKACSTQF